MVASLSTSAPSATPFAGLGGAAPAPPIEVTANVARSSYLPGEPVVFTVAARNMSGTTLTLEPWAPDVDVVDGLTEQVVRSFPAGHEMATLGSGQSGVREFEWDQRDDAGNAVPPGYYGLSVKRLAGEGFSVGSLSSINTQGIDKVFIRYPQGSLERSISVGETVVLDGVQVVLDRVEFEQSGTTVYVRAIPPAYNFPEGAHRPAMPPLSVLPFEPVSQYQINGESPRGAGAGGFNPDVTAIDISWRINPVPADCTLFQFTVTSLGRWTGPWAFTVPIPSR